MLSGKVSLKIVFAWGVVLLAAGGFIYWGLWGQYQTSISERKDLETELRAKQDNIAQLEEEKANLQSALEAEQDRLKALGEEVGDIAQTVGILDKLSKTDPELLQKYSKVFFLNEHYIPSSLSPIDSDLLIDSNRSLLIHSSVLPYLEDMIEDALDDGVEMYVASAYRSFGTQSSLKAGYTVTYGAGTANQFSADQGYSEHQLGTTADITTKGIAPGLTGFENTQAYQWMRDNAHRYGFALSYPEGNAYYVFEPWHWRFVGVKLARYLDREDLYFYDLDQRKIDEYLVNVFD